MRLTVNDCGCTHHLTGHPDCAEIIAFYCKQHRPRDQTVKYVLIKFLFMVAVYAALASWIFTLTLSIGWQMMLLFVASIVTTIVAAAVTEPAPKPWWIDVEWPRR